MGNRALRREAGRLIKLRGFGKLYYGNKRVSYKLLRAGELRHLIRILSIAPGDLFNDCDAYNHRLIDYVPERRTDRFWLGSRQVHCRVFGCDQVVKEDGSWSCGCPSGPDRPWSKQEIEDYHREFCSEENLAELRKNGWKVDESEKIAERLRQGLPICDENGMKIDF